MLSGWFVGLACVYGWFGVVVVEVYMVIVCCMVGVESLVAWLMRDVLGSVCRV